MNDLIIQKLFLLYQSGVVSTSDPNETEVLQLAKAVGSDMTQEEFVWMFTEVHSMQKLRDARNETFSDFTAGKSDVANHQVRPMGPSEYQERLWEIPDLARTHEKPFVPSRLADGTPIDIDRHAPQETQDRFRSLPYHQVMHDPKLRDTWHAAQSGKLTELLQTGELWHAYTDTNAIADSVDLGSLNREHLSAPLRAMLSMIDAGTHMSDLSPEVQAMASQLPTSRIRDTHPELVYRQLMSKDKDEAAKWRDYYAGPNGLPASKTSYDKVLSQDPVAVKRWIGEMRDNHAMNARQMMVDRQLEKSIPSLSTPAPKRSFVDELFGTGKPGLPPVVAPPVQQPSPPPVQAPPVQAPTVPPPPVHTVQAPPVQIPPNFWESVGASSPSNDSLGIVDNPVPPSGGFTDTIQTVLDGVGVADPTPIADGVNTAISIVRAISDPRNAGTHLTNAAVSAVSMIPYLGDLAKLGKYGAKGAKAAGGSGGGLGSSLGNAAGALGGLIGSLGGGGGSNSGSPPGNSPPGGTNTPGGGSVGGLGPFAVVIGGAIALAVGDFLHRFAAGKKLFEPYKYTGDSFDSAKSMSERGMDQFNTAAPIGIKWGPFGFALGFATRQLNKWVDWLQRVEQGGNAMINANRELANYSGTLAGSFATLDADRVRRDMAKASALSGPLSGLARNQSEFEAAKQDLFQPFEQMAISVQSSLTWFATQTIKIVDSMELVSEFIGWWYSKGEADEERSALEKAISSHKIELEDKL